MSKEVHPLVGKEVWSNDYEDYAYVISVNSSQTKVKIKLKDTEEIKTVDIDQIELYNG